jgi:hypothetical protein
LQAEVALENQFPQTPNGTSNSHELKMADEEKKKFPSMPTGQWWALRRKFRNTIPREVTPTYLASALGMAENSAAANILPSLRETGLIDGDSKPTELAVKWRDDAEYPKVCDSIRRAVYPHELLDIAPDISVDRAAVQRWFLNHTGKGEAAAYKYTSFYMLLLESDPSRQAAQAPSLGKTKEAQSLDTPRRARAVTKLVSKPLPHASVDPALPPAAGRGSSGQPEIHIDVQLHISPEASADQIDQIFASMAKHLRDSR